MNVFYIDESPEAIAKALVDKHIVKMPVESAQMLSTAHRLLDGVEKQIKVQRNGKSRAKKIYLLPGESVGTGENREWYADAACYSVAHPHHPSTKWTMQSKANYLWHVELLKAMLAEYTRRYGRTHACEKFVPFLECAPTNIPDVGFSEPPPAMPEHYLLDSWSVVDAYRSYYAGDKWKFAKWKHGIMPRWFPTYFATAFNKNAEVNQTTLASARLKNTLPMDERVFNLAMKMQNDNLHTSLV